MKKSTSTRMRVFFLKTIFLLFCIIGSTASWELLEQGLELGTFQSSLYNDSIDAPVMVLRIDLRYFDLQLFNASDSQYGQLLSTGGWCKEEKLVAAINAGMYQTDYRTSVSYMRTSTHVNNSRLSGDKTILAFGRRSKSIPPVKILDRQCEDFGEWKGLYSSFVQSIRMISCKGSNVWTQQKEKWSIAAIGTDKKGRVLFMHSVAPHTGHDFAKMILDLPLDIDRAMYSEGGSDAQLSIYSGGREINLTGEYNGAGYCPTLAPPLPNVVGVIRKLN